MLETSAGIHYNSKLHDHSVCLIEIIPVISASHHHGSAHLRISDGMMLNASSWLCGHSLLSGGNNESYQVDSADRRISMGQP
ncbi:hypothetical protein GJ744_005876 [Endocarpon pusillum]|uniref:Uncharacterized protein n=1 Tax=Endocarpon pusillum TaxID=364733 RepID=A0A8H7E8I0_9EURO|nr:hypothetical protein GJ744_005876 [Endocarpon pusillum]